MRWNIAKLIPRVLGIFKGGSSEKSENLSNIFFLKMKRKLAMNCEAWDNMWLLGENAPIVPIMFEKEMNMNWKVQLWKSLLKIYNLLYLNIFQFSNRAERFLTLKLASITEQTFLKLDGICFLVHFLFYTP